MGFEVFGLKDELVKATESLGFQSPMPIQEKAISALLSGEKDFVGLAQTGTGKTGAFGLPLLQLIDADNVATQGIVICPTRELCLQITKDLKEFAGYMRKVKIAAIYGGARIPAQVKRLKGKPQIIVATPGRLIDMINRRAADLSQVSYAVLDEADEMLNMGFKEDIDSILKKMPVRRKIWLFSATMPKGVAAIARNYLTDPVEVRVGDPHQSPKNIRHICHTIQNKNKYPELKRIIDSLPDILALVFCRTRKDTQDLADSLMRDSYQSEALHGALSQFQRDKVMRKFRRGSVRILVATDVAARGLDVDDITHVIHYNLPDGMEIYTHRSGRTGRVGKSGISIALVNPRENNTVRMMEKRLNIRFEFNTPPPVKAVCEKEYAGNSTASTKTRTKARPESKSIRELRAKSKPVKTKNRLKPGKGQRFFVNMGRLDKINKGFIVRLICDKSGIGPEMIGEISLNREFSFFEVQKQAAKRVYKSLNAAKHNGRTLEIHRAI